MIGPILHAAIALIAASMPTTAPLKDLMAKLQPLGWTFAGSLDNSLVYQHGGPSAGMIWVRFEYLDPQGGGANAYKSDAQLRNYDCQAGLYQILQRTPYADHNLSGASVTVTVDEAKTYSASDPVAVELQKDVCSGAQ